MIEATDETLLLQVPPTVALLNVVVAPPEHKLGVPKIGPSVGTTVNVLVAGVPQPLE